MGEARVALVTGAGRGMGAAIDWSRVPKLFALLPEHGGHAGFHGRDGRVPWHDQAIAGFFAPHSTL